ncbi:MAG: hypothetical protein M0Z43_09795 [Acidithiobacillus sp.]|nr:hypothetical protein [Acidithiobacillus sp.]
MAWKVTEEGHIAVQDGNPVWIGDDGTESAFDAKANIIAAATAKREAAESRKGLKEAQDKLAAFAGIEDPAAAIKALQFAGSMEGKKVMDDEAIKKLIESAVKPVQEENVALKTAVGERDSTIYKMKVSDKFNTSPFIKDKTIFAETPDVAEAYFARHFRVEEGKTIAYDGTGNPIYSSIKAGELADFDEAMSILVNSHPRKEHMLKSTAASGSGSFVSGSGAADKGPKTITRAEFEAKSPAEQSAIALARNITITD